MGLEEGLQEWVRSMGLKGYVYVEEVFGHITARCTTLMQAFKASPTIDADFITARRPVLKVHRECAVA